MAKDPAFLFYPGDWLGGTLGMTFEEKGAYMELLMLQFNRGHMTKRMVAQTVGQLWESIEDKFQVDKEGKYFNARLEKEQKARKSFTASRRNNLKGTNQHTKNKGRKTSHKEDENEDENKGKEENEITLPFDSENFAKEWAIWKQDRRDRKIKKYTPRGEQGALHQLQKDSGDNEEIAIQIIQKSITSGYQGLFPLKNNNQNQSVNGQLDEIRDIIAERDNQH